jgi:hypothetical protein
MIMDEARKDKTSQYGGVRFLKYRSKIYFTFNLLSQIVGTNSETFTHNVAMTSFTSHIENNDKRDVEAVANTSFI